MLSGIKSRLQHLRISTKLTLVHVAILAVILFITQMITTAGIYFTVYHQAWSELEQTIENTLLAIELADPEKMPKNGPPEQVSRIRFTSARSPQPMRHWKIAECSESTGMISAP